MKSGIEVLTRKMMSQPLIQVETERRAEQKKRMSRHHFNVATWKIVGKKEISCNVKLMSQHRSWKNKKTIMSRHNTEVVTSTLKEH